MATRGRVRFRAATAADLPRCGTIWRDALNGYLGRLSRPEIPSDLGPIGRLHAHLLATDPGRFVVATRARAGSGERPRGDDVPIAFAAAVERGNVWYLSMLFVTPAEQGAGVGRALLGRVLPTGVAGAPGATHAAGILDVAGRAAGLAGPAGPAGLAGPAEPVLALTSDSLQPISNGLYASLGIVPRVPLWHLVGRPERPDALPPLPAGVTVERPDTSVEQGPPPAIGVIDREILGFEHPRDHGFAIAEGRLGFIYHAPNGALLGYGYASPVGHLGPVAVLDPALLPAVLGHLLAAVEPRGASAAWVSGMSGGAFTALTRAGLRLDGFPLLLAWSRPFADFERYIPLSPGLL